MIPDNDNGLPDELVAARDFDPTFEGHLILQMRALETFRLDIECFGSFSTWDALHFLDDPWGLP